MRSRLILVAIGIISTCRCLAHDIPDASVNRSIQVELIPGRIRIDYEIRLSELTLTQDLKALIGDLPGGDRTDWFQRYGKETGPLIARGLILTIDTKPIELAYLWDKHVADEEPCFTFRLEGAVPAKGRLRLFDSNFAAAEGTSRLAVRSFDRIQIDGDTEPNEVDQIPIKPIWQLTAEEERRSKLIEIVYYPKPALITQRSPSWAILTLLAFMFGFSYPLPTRHVKLGTGLSLVASVIQLVALAAVASLSGIIGLIDHAGGSAGIRDATGFVITAIGLWEIGRSLPRSSNTMPASDSDHTRFRLLPPIDTIALCPLTCILGRLNLMFFAITAFSIGTLLRRLLGDHRFTTCLDRPLKLINGLLLAIMGACVLTNGFDTLR